MAMPRSYLVLGLIDAKQEENLHDDQAEQHVRMQNAANGGQIVTVSCIRPSQNKSVEILFLD